MAITAAQVKELRERTGLAMMECKKALVASDGDIDGAIEHLRKSGLAAADKKAGRVAAEGSIVIVCDASCRRAAMVEVNCETDFVSKGDEFLSFADRAASLVLNEHPADVAALMNLPVGQETDQTVDEMRRALVAKLGENINVRRFISMTCEQGLIGSYRHGSRIGVLVRMEKGTPELAKDIAMHIAASRPLALHADDIPAAIVAREKEIFAAQARESGKPPEIIEKMISGRLRKFTSENTLLGQPFVKNPDISVGQLLTEHQALVSGFERFEVGEGIEKRSENFAEEVLAQAQGS